MKYVLIPVKDLSRAKERLSGLMSQEERTALAWLMLEHVFGEVSQAGGYDRVAVVTLYEPAVELGRRLGFEIIREEEQISESISVDYGSRVAGERGALAVLRLPIDLPLVAAGDIERVLSHLPGGAGGRSTVMVPSLDGSGTNALGRNPPDLFPSCFGPGSLARHRAEARRREAGCELLYSPGIACDVDDPKDLAYLMEHGRGSRAHDFLADLRISRRLRRARPRRPENGLPTPRLRPDFDFEGADCSGPRSKT